LIDLYVYRGGGVGNEIKAAAEIGDSLDAVSCCGLQSGYILLSSFRRICLSVHRVAIVDVFGSSNLYLSQIPELAPWSVWRIRYYWTRETCTESHGLRWPWVTLKGHFGYRIPRCNRTYGTCTSFCGTLTVRWPHYMTKINYV